VVLRISRAATACKWSPSGKKFAVASGSRLVPVCHYEDDNKWWVSEQLKKFRSTVLSIDWHPNSKFLLTGSSDYKARIFSAFLDKVEEDVDADYWGSVFPEHNVFGAVLWEFDACQAWVNSVCWSPSGNSVAFAGHDSSIHFAAISAEPQVQSITHGFLPFLSIAFLGETTVIAAGFNNNAAFFADSGSGWGFVDRLDKEEGKQEKKAASGMKSQLNKFQEADKRGVQFGKDAVDTSLKTVHQNTISQVTPFFTNDKATVVATTGIDGRLQLWDLAKSQDLGALKLR